MSKETPKDQPENVATEDAIRPSDNVVTTSDTASPEPTTESRSAGEGSQQAAAATSTEGGTKSPDSATGEDKSTKRRNRSAERKIGKLKSQLERAEGRSAAQTQEIERLMRENETLKGSVAEQLEPKLEDFKTPAEYAKAYNKWEAGKKAAKQAPPPQTPTTHDGQQPPEKNSPELDEAVAGFHRAGKEMLGDEFLEALEVEGIAVNQFMAEYLFHSDVGPAIYVHLANNVSESRDIYDMPPQKAVEALKALEAKSKKGALDIDGQLKIEPSNDQGGDTKANPGETKAPTPPSSTREPGTPNMDPNPGNENMDDYAARRRKEEARKKGLPV